MSLLTKLTDDFDEGKFHYTAEGQNGGTTQRTYFEFITLKADPSWPSRAVSPLFGTIS